jgi:hypothetical protein
MTSGSGNIVHGINVSNMMGDSIMRILWGEINIGELIDCDDASLIW